MWFTTVYLGVFILAEKEMFILNFKGGGGSKVHLLHPQGFLKPLYVVGKSLVGINK